MKLHALFSNHVVLQQNKSLPVWGWATPGDTIDVEFAGQRKVAYAGKGGKWVATLDPMPASAQGRDLVVRSLQEDRKTTVHDVLVGEVWVISGQSNMQWSVQLSANGEAEAAAADDSKLRLFTVPNRAITSPQDDVEAEWESCSPEAVAPFSAVGYFFARELRRVMGIPIGLINASWGGTRIEAWISREALMTHPAARREIEAYETGPVDPLQRSKWDEFAKDPRAWEQRNVIHDPGNEGFAKGWASGDCDDRAWREMEVPSHWQDFGHNYSGVFWFRRTVDLPERWAGKDLVLHLGACDKQDTTYFNNTPVGGIGWEKADAWCTPRVYNVPGALVRAGRNVISTRVYSYIYHGGLTGPAESMRLARPASNDLPIPLAGPWRYEIEHNFGLRTTPPAPLGPENPNTPYILFDSMITALAPFGIRGFLWYQGESNVDKAKDYRALLPLLIRNWRQVFGQGDVPFFFVQLASHLAAQKQPSEGGWALLREAQLQAMSEPNTAMAVTIDIGHPLDIHPPDKQDVGKRLALAALALVHERPIAFSGPIYRSHHVEGDAIRLHFNHTNGGLRASGGGALKGFAIAGADQAFEWAQAEIENDSVRVHSPQVARPIAVRYAWASNPLGNLTNGSGLPASPFRTDQW